MGNRGTTAVTLLALGFTLGCGPSNQGSGPSYASGVMASLAANANLSQAQVSTFQADVRSKWAVAYDPAVPPGCTPGGVGDGVSAAAIGDRPCKAFVLERLKTAWMLRAVGTPGQMALPEGLPKDLGDPGRLRYLGGP